MELHRVVVPKHTEGLLHPYGVVVDNDYVYVTVQDTNSMMRFSIQDGQAAPYPVALHDKAFKHPPPFSPGTFIKFDEEVNSVRGVAMDEKRGRLWVANKDRGLLVFKRDGGFLEVSDMGQLLPSCHGQFLSLAHGMAWLSWIPLALGGKYVFPCFLRLHLMQGSPLPSSTAHIMMPSWWGTSILTMFFNLTPKPCKSRLTLLITS